ncbi:hypothetical protein F4820DRAFT_431677 [Hypoxylon rubiginosum]|uniref:Uncharacterized protein n=1 Tax=Hypoxylon rubiginosum TaxID=110542 RepID=A0ACB9YS86_9PEZI|nr:hypothetical protein F4820DRAFT_431677 [Hypoxylon rubiginosum]
MFERRPKHVLTLHIMSALVFSSACRRLEEAETLYAPAQTSSQLHPNLPSPIDPRDRIIADVSSSGSRVLDQVETMNCQARKMWRAARRQETS